MPKSLYLVMNTIKLQFPNADGQELAARLELSVDKKIEAYALFARKI